MTKGAVAFWLINLMNVVLQRMFSPFMEAEAPSACPPPRESDGIPRRAVRRIGSYLFNVNAIHDGHRGLHIRHSDSNRNYGGEYLDHANP